MQNDECRMQTMKIQERAFLFACRIVRMHRALSRDRTARRLADQLLDAGTSVAANLEEAEAAHTKPDFIAKCRISLKEARETLYWLRLITATGLVRSSRMAPVMTEANEIVAIVTSIVKKATRSPHR
jgi:four helix bundle protein